MYTIQITAACTRSSTSGRSRRHTMYLFTCIWTYQYYALVYVLYCLIFLQRDYIRVYTSISCIIVLYYFICFEGGERGSSVSAGVGGTADTARGRERKEREGCVPERGRERKEREGGVSAGLPPAAPPLRARSRARLLRQRYNNTGQTTTMHDIDT